MEGKQINTNLEVHVSFLQDYFIGLVNETKYHIQFYPSRLIYMSDLEFCNDVVKDYAFKIQMVKTIDEVCDVIKELYEKVMQIPNMRVDVLFDAYDVAHKSNESRHDAHSRIILDDNFIAYNSQIPEEERKYILYSLLEFKGFLDLPKIKENDN